MASIKKIFYFFVLLCSVIGLYFSIVGLVKFADNKILFIIAIYSCCLAFLLSAFEIMNRINSTSNSLYKSILNLAGGLALIFASVYLLFLTQTSLFVKVTSVFGILFFSANIVKILFKKK